MAVNNVSTRPDRGADEYKIGICPWHEASLFTGFYFVENAIFI